MKTSLVQIFTKLEFLTRILDLSRYLGNQNKLKFELFLGVFSHK